MNIQYFSKIHFLILTMVFVLIAPIICQPVHVHKDMYDSILKTNKLAKYLDQWEGKTSAGLPPLGIELPLSKITINEITEITALDWYTELANKNNSYAQCIVGYYYENLPYSWENVEKAFSWYTKASDNAYTPGMYLLAYCGFTNKALLEKNEIIRLVKKASDAGYPSAQFFYASFIISNPTTEKEQEEYMKLIQQAADADYAEAQYLLALEHSFSFRPNYDKEKAKNYIDKAAELNLPSAQRFIAVDYLKDTEGNKNIALALEYFKKAGLNGDAFSMEDVAFFYRGNYSEIPYDKEEAIHWFEKSQESFSSQINEQKKRDMIIFRELQKRVQKDSFSALNNLSYAYLYGQGTPIDEQKAIELMEEVCTKYEGLLSQSIIAYAYSSGFSVKKDLHKALFWFKEAHRYGKNVENEIEAIYNAVLGIENYCAELKVLAYSSTNKKEILPITTQHIPLDEAFSWYETKAIQGDPLSQSIVAFCFMHGLGTNKNTTNAFKWYEKADSAGFVPAHYALGLLYENGIGVSKDIQKAYTYYLDCIEKKYIKAYLKVAAMYLLGDGVLRDSKKSSEYSKIADSNNIVTVNYSIDPKTFDDFEEYKKLYAAAKTEKPEDLYNLSRFFYKQYQDQDHMERIILLKKAAEKNHKEAKAELAHCYLRGNSIQQDILKAIKLYESLIDMDNGESYYQLGKIYWEGTLIERDREKAINLLSKGRDKKNDDADSLLAKILGEKVQLYDDDNNYYEDTESSTDISSYGKKITIDSLSALNNTNFTNDAESVAIFFFASFLRGDTEWKKTCDPEDYEYLEDLFTYLYSIEYEGMKIISYDIFPETLEECYPDFYTMKVGFTFLNENQETIFSGVDDIEFYNENGIWTIWSIPE